MKLTWIGLVAFCAALIMPLAVFAAPSVGISVTGAGALVGSGVTLPWGAYVSAVLGWLQPLVVSLAVASLAFASRELPAWLVALMRESLTQARIQRAVNWAITQIDGAVKGETLTLDGGSALAAMAERYMLTYAPDIAAKLGERLKPMILAEIGKIGSAPAKKLASPLPSKPLPQLNK